MIQVKPERQEILVLTAEIVGNYVKNNGLAADDLLELISNVYRRLLELSDAPVEKENAPAISINKSITDVSITCLECGKSVAILKRHLRQTHKMTPEEYRIKWDLGPDYPLVAPAYTKKRSQLAINFGLGHARKKRQAPTDNKKSRK